MQVEVGGGVKRDNFLIFPCASLGFVQVAFPDLSRCGWIVSAAVGQGVGNGGVVDGRNVERRTGKVADVEWRLRLLALQTGRVVKRKAIA